MKLISRLLVIALGKYLLRGNRLHSHAYFNAHRQLIPRRRFRTGLGNQLIHEVLKIRSGFFKPHRVYVGQVVRDHILVQLQCRHPRGGRP